MVNVECFDPRMDNSTASNQIEVLTSNLTSSLRGLSQGDKKLSVEFAFEENISHRFFFLPRINYVACKNKATWFRYLEFKQEDVFMHRAVEVSFFTKHITFLISKGLVVLLK